MHIILAQYRSVKASIRPVKKKGKGKGEMNLLRKSMMFILSFSPLYLLISIMNLAVFDRFFHKEATPSDNLFIALIVILSITSAASLIIFAKVPSVNYIHYSTIKRPKDIVLSYLFTYIIPFVAMDLDNLGTVLANIFLFLLIWCLYVRLNLFYINPILSVFGYLSYEADGKIIITNIPYQKLIHTHKLNGAYFSDEIFVAKKQANPSK